MAENKNNRLTTLVRGASTDLAPEEPLRRGRGLTGMITDQAEMSTSIQADMSTSIQADMSTSIQADMSTSGHLPATPTKIEDAPRTVKSYRIRHDLAHRIDVLAATERRKIYEVVEEALDLYLRARDEERAEQRRV